MPAVRLLVSTRGQAPNTIYLGDDGETLVAAGAADKQLALATDYSGFTTSNSIADASRPVHTVAVTSWVVTPADRYREVRFTSAQPITLRVPSQLSVDLPLGLIGAYRQDGAGQITVVGDAGVMVSSPSGSLTSSGATIMLEKVGAQNVRVTGTTSPDNGVTAPDPVARRSINRQQLWSRSFTGLRPLNVMASPPTVTLPSNTGSTINGSGNASGLPARGLYPQLTVAGFQNSQVMTGNPNAAALRALGPANTDGSVNDNNLWRIRFTAVVPQFEVVFSEVSGSLINALVDGQLVTAGGVGVIPVPLQSGNTRYLKFDFGTDTTTFGIAKSDPLTTRGTGYATGDTVTLVGGTFTRPATYRVVASADTSVFSTVLQDPGDYTAFPTFPADTTTSGSGTGLKIPQSFRLSRHTTMKPRQIELLISSAYIHGINFTTPASGEPAVTPYKLNPRIPSLYWLGDSQDANTYGTYNGGQMGFLVALRLGLLDNLQIDARGGTGFNVPNGTAPAFEHANRIAAVIAAAPDFVVFPYSQNIGSNTQATSQAAAISFVTQIQNALPNCRLVMVGPAFGNQSWHLAAMQATLAAAPIPANIRMVDTIGEGWNSGGFNGFLTNDGVHWSQPGNFEWRSKVLAEHVAAALQDMIDPL